MTFTAFGVEQPLDYRDWWVGFCAQSVFVFLGAVEEVCFVDPADEIGVVLGVPFDDRVAGLSQCLYCSFERSLNRRVRRDLAVMPDHTYR